MICNRRGFLAAAGALSLSHLAPALGQTPFPSKPLKLVVPFAPGGANDQVGRLLAAKLQGVFGQPVVVDNRAGAGGAIGAHAVARSDPDGYTILFHSSTLVIQPNLLKAPGYDARKDFVPVSLLTQAPLVLEVHPSIPVKTFSDFLAYARAKDSQLFYGSAGNGSAQHLVGELFNSMAGTRMKHVPFRGNGPATTALLGGEIQVMFDIIPISKPLAESGKVRILAVTGNSRSPSLPHTPTINESGVAGFDFTFWQAISLPTGTPAPIVQQWRTAMKKVLAEPSVQSRLTEMGYQVVGSSPDELGDRMQRESAQWAKVIASAGIRSE